MAKKHVAAVFTKLLKERVEKMKTDGTLKPAIEVGSAEYDPGKKTYRISVQIPIQYLIHDGVCGMCGNEWATGPSTCQVCHPRKLCP